MGEVRDYCGSKVCSGQKGLAPSTGTRGGGWGAKSFLHGNAGKITTIEAKSGNLSGERKASCLPKSVKAWWNSRDEHQIPRMRQLYMQWE